MKITNLIFILKLALSVLLFSLEATAETLVEFTSQLCLSEKQFLDNCKPLTVKGTLYEGSKDSIVMVTHNSDGVDERHHRYGRYLQSLGISAVVIEHWKARGAWGAQNDFVGWAKRGANPHNMVIDVQHAIHHFRGLGYKKFGFIGESMGGGVAMLLNKREWQHHFSRVSGKTPNQLDAIVGLYGNCNERYSYDRYLSSPMLVVMGELDQDAPSITCRNYVTEWANPRGAQIAFVELAGQHHDFDAGFPLQKLPLSQNPSRCISTVDLKTITSTLNGKTYPNTPDGWSEWRSSCILKGYENPARYGNTGDPNTGFKEWGQFFVQQLL